MQKEIHNATFGMEKKKNEKIVIDALFIFAKETTQEGETRN